MFIDNDYKVWISQDPEYKTWQYQVKKRTFLWFYKEISFGCLILQEEQALQAVFNVIRAEQYWDQRQLDFKYVKDHTA